MTHFTRRRLRSGARPTLDGVVERVRGHVRRKGGECKGPHADPPEEYRVPQHATLAADDTAFDPWNYTVYTRRLSIHGSDHVAREVGHMSFPSAVRVEIEVERRRPVGSS